MSEETPEVKQEAEPQLAAPICPYCKADPIHVIGRMFNMGPFYLLLSMCGACRYIVPASVVEIAQPQIAPPPSGIVMPS